MAAKPQKPVPRYDDVIDKLSKIQLESGESAVLALRHMKPALIKGILNVVALTADHKGGYGALNNVDDVFDVVVDSTTGLAMPDSEFSDDELEEEFEEARGHD